MASLHSLLISVIILMLLVWLTFETTNAQTTMSECGPTLLPLAACAPFVQGSAISPVQLCCDNLKQLYVQTPTCLCLLLNQTSLGSLPLNSTLALKLPVMCSLQMDASTCSDTTVPSIPPSSEVSFGSRPNSTNAATPKTTVLPRPSIMGFGYPKSAEDRLKVEGHFLMLLLLLASIFPVLANIKC